MKLLKEEWQVEAEENSEGNAGTEKKEIAAEEDALCCRKGNDDGIVQWKAREFSRQAAEGNQNL